MKPDTVEAKRVRSLRARRPCASCGAPSWPTPGKEGTCCAGCRRAQRGVALALLFAGDRLDALTGCRIWTGGTLKDGGYGRVRFAGKDARAHRVAWILANGPIPTGLVVCHACDNPPCVNVEHLFLGTHDDNMADMVAKGRGAGRFTKGRVWPAKKPLCKHGHDDWRPRRGGRYCATCTAARNAKRGTRGHN